MDSAQLSGTLVRTFLALVAVSALAVVSLRLLGQRLGRRRGRAMRVLDSLALDGRRAVYLVEVPGKVLVVGSAERGLQPLGELDPELVRAKLAAGESPLAEAQSLDSNLPGAS